MPIKIDDTRQQFFTCAQVAQRWMWHVESVRRKLRRREIGSVVIGKRRLIPVAEIERIEGEGTISAVDRNAV